MQCPNRCGVVSWINPNVSPKRPKIGSYQSDSSGIFYDEVDATISEQVNKYSGSTVDFKQQVTGEFSSRRSKKLVKSPVINSSICRIISTIVDQHLGDLQDHQRLVNMARTKLASRGHWRICDTSDPDSFFRRDMWKMKVRSQQIKAVETIKQLTNYLRELTFLMSENQTTDDDETFNKLSDIRTDIVQALNDFVLSNSDIDIPIVDPEDVNCYEYDLLKDAQRIQNNHGIFSPEEDDKEECGDQTTLTGEISSLSESEEVKLETGSVLSSETLFANLDKRKQDVEKLERDTEQLRLLFSDFYSLVKSHGEQVDSIEDNIVIAIQHVHSVPEVHNHKQLNRVRKGLTILVPVTGCMAGVLVGGPLGLVVGGKLGGITVACATSLIGLISSYKVRRCMI